MADHTHIEWTDATWNPVTGCTKVSPGCDHCYAETIAHRFAGTPAYPNGFDVTLRPERLSIPLRWKRPRRVFVNSMSDLFHADIPDEYIARVFEVMARASQHTFQVLTKRHARARALLSRPSFRDNLAHWGRPWPLPNVWLGVSVEDQQWADIRIPALLGTPAAVRFISAEPLLGAVQLVADEPRFGGGGLAGYRSGGPASFFPGIDWVIVGGESGTGARPMHPDWARSLRDQCQAARVPFLFKQWGEWAPLHRPFDYVTNDYRCQIVDDSGSLRGRPWSGWKVQDGTRTAEPMRRYGKRAAGRELDGRTWDEYPAGAR